MFANGVFNGVFKIPVDDQYVDVPEEIETLVLPFVNCPNGNLQEDSRILYKISATGFEEMLELETEGSPDYYGRWEVPCRCFNLDTFGKVLAHLWRFKSQGLAEVEHATFVRSGNAKPMLLVSKLSPLDLR